MRFFLFTALVIGFSSFSVFGQNSEDNDITANINVSAEVIPSIELITVNSMQFGNVPPGQREIYINPVNNLNAGFMIAIGAPEANFRLNYVPELELTQVNGENTLSFIYEISVNDIDNQATSELIENENRSLQFNEEGRFYIWLGGRVPIENAAPGNYEGDFTIEIDYI